MSDKLDTSNLEAILEELEKRAINHLHEILEEIQESAEGENRSPIGEALIRYLENSNATNSRYIESQMRIDLTLIELLKFEILDALIG
jgi:formate dehydrogenase maturation protein FdhE